MHGIHSIHSLECTNVGDRKMNKTNLESGRGSKTFRTKVLIQSKATSVSKDKTVDDFWLDD